MSTNEINDELNKKYSDIVSSDEVSEQSTSERNAELIGNEVEQGNNEAIHELNNPGVPQQASLSEQRDVAIPFVNGEKNLSNNAERVVSNQQDMNTTIEEVSSLDDNVNATENVQQVSSQSTAATAENYLTPPLTPAVIAQN